MRTQIPFALLAATLASSLFCVSAHARARVFVASYGDDANPCTFLSPCRNFQQAVNVADAGGEVTAIDSAGFGPINITKAVTITSPDGVEAGIVASAGADAIDVDAGANDAIVLRGLTLNGLGVGAYGVRYNSGRSLTVINCVAQNFVNGLQIQPTSGSISFAVTNTTVLNNGSAGINIVTSFSPTVNGAIDHLVATGNSAAISGGGGGMAMDLAISNSILSKNIDGISVGGGSAITVSIDNVTLNGNSGSAITASLPASVLLSRSVIQGNHIGTSNSTSNSFYSYGNNLIDLNANNFVGTPLNQSVTLR